MASWSRRLVVELGKDVVEQQHRVARRTGIGPQQLETAQPQRQRGRPRLAVAGVAAHRQLTDGQVDVVAVRSDEVHPALELGRPHPVQFGEQGGLAGRRRRPHPPMPRSGDPRDGAAVGDHQRSRWPGRPARTRRPRVASAPPTRPAGPPATGPRGRPGGRPRRPGWAGSSRPPIVGRRRPTSTARRAASAPDRVRPHTGHPRRAGDHEFVEEPCGARPGRPGRSPDPRARTARVRSAPRISRARGTARR